MQNDCCLPILKAQKKVNQVKTITTTDSYANAINNIKGNIWLSGLFGVEKENLRVDKLGNLAQTPHPAAFGDKLKHPYITTDFSESQVEMRTPPLPNLSETLGFLETMHDIVSLELTDEYLWPQSIPPAIPDNTPIPIAQYGNEGDDARKYREILAAKYGPKNQLFSGIHFNFSFGKNLLELLYHRSNTTLSFNEFSNELYLKTIRQVLRLRWLYVLLYGNSPVADASLELRCKLEPEKIDRHVFGLSIRNSCYGYQNFGELYPDYSSVPGFKKSIEQLIQQGVLTSPKELYASVRPKFTGKPDEISYVEMRFVDIDPLEKSGITSDTLHFLHALALYGAFTEEPDSFDANAQNLANTYHSYVSLYGLQTTPFLQEYMGRKINVWAEAKQHLANMKALFSELGITDTNFIIAVEKAAFLIENPKQRRVYEVLEGVLKMGYVPFHLNQAQMFAKQSSNNTFNFFGYTDMELSTQLLLREAVKRGVAFEILDRNENFILLSRNGNIQWVKQATRTSLDNYASVLAMENKQITKKILDDTGIKTPHGNLYTSAENAVNDYVFFENKPIVVKPNQTNFGIGITILKENTNFEVFKRAVEMAFEHDTSVLVEEFIDGREFRIFVIGNEVVGILHRVPANVKGDGLHSIRELVEIKNQDPLRGKGYRTPLEKLQMGEAETVFLKLQQKDFDYVPAFDEIVYLRENSNISTGGDSIDFTDDIPDSYKKIAVDAAHALNVQITGLDMIIKDYTTEATPDNYAIIEMNFNPAIHIHCHPYIGKNRKLNGKILDALGY